MNARTKLLLRGATLFSAAACILASGCLSAQDSAVLDSMPHAERISEVALSPDGSQVAYVVEGKITVISSAGENSHAIAVENVLALRTGGSRVSIE